MRPLRWLRRRLRDDRGVSMLEFAGFLPILLVIGMAAIQLGLIGYGINQAGTGRGRRPGSPRRAATARRPDRPP